MRESITSAWNLIPTPAVETNSTSTRVGDSCLVVNLTPGCGSTEETVSEFVDWVRVTMPKPSTLYAVCDVAAEATVVAGDWSVEGASVVAGESVESPSELRIDPESVAPDVFTSARGRASA